MTTLKIAAALALLSTISPTQVLAQFSEPAAFASQHPDRDVLNNGALTPEARAAAGLERGSYSAVGSTGSPPGHGTHGRLPRHR